MSLLTVSSMTREERAMIFRIAADRNTNLSQAVRALIREESERLKSRDHGEQGAAGPA